MAKMMQVALERLLPKIDIVGFDRCWGWNAGTDRDGYGRINLDRRSYPVMAHRVIYELFTMKPIPEGLVVRHSCDNPPCCNPMHLLLGTHADNIRDREERGRTRGPVGEKNSNAKLTADQVLAIRSAEGTQQRIADRFGVSRSLVSMVHARKVWKHL